MKEIFDAQTYKELLEKFNPFGFKEPDGRSSVFNNYGELYYHIMEKIVTTFPRGYIDIILLIMEEMKISINDAEKIFRKHFMRVFKTEYKLVELWNEDDKERDKFFRDLLFCFHSYSGTKFNESYYRDALLKYNERNSKLNLEKRTLDGSVLNPVADIQ